jgi:putative endonuclease
MKILELLTFKRKLGNKGEAIAVKELKRKGYKILKKNYVAAGYEIDVIAENRDTLAFVEVKTRNGDQYGYPSEAVTATKQQRIKRAAEQYLQGRRMNWNKVSFDVYEVMTELIEDCM